MNNARLLKALIVTFCLFVAFVLVAPLGVVFPLGFAEAQSFQFLPKAYSAQWYAEFWTSPEWASRLRSSLVIAVLTTTLSVTAGTMAAFGVRRLPPGPRAFVIGCVLAPVVVPTVLIAFANYSVFLELELVGTYVGFVLSHAMIALPMVFIPVWASLSGFDATMERAAASLGASRLRTFRTVTLPLIAPGVLAGAVFAFITSWDEVVVASFISTPALITLPVGLFIRITEATDPTVAAVASMMILAVLAAVSAYAASTRLRRKGV